MVNMFLFKGFMYVPFLFELRSVMDWMWTETSMGVFDWLKMEDIFSHIFTLKVGCFVVIFALKTLTDNTFSVNGIWRKSIHNLEGLKKVI